MSNDKGNPTATADRTVLVAVTVSAGDEPIFVLQTSAGRQRIAQRATLADALTDIARDPTTPEHKVEAGGFDVGAVMRGVGRYLEAFGRGEQ